MSGEVRGIVLVGYRATGKSTVGRLVAERLARPFLDLDREVEALEGRSIRSIFLEAGELAFRELESRVIGGLADRLAGGVVATGGGAILRESNRQKLRDFGFVAWLTADAETLTRRLQLSVRGVEDRPALTASGTLGEVAEVLEARTPYYREVSHASISTEGRSAEAVADAVVEAWLRHVGSSPPGVVF
jgi:shikimate kinase